MNVRSQDILKTAINHCDGVLTEQVYNSLPAGELIKACDIKIKYMTDFGLMAHLVKLKEQGRVRTYKYNHIQLWGRVDEFTN